MQMLATIDTGGYDAWKARFDERAEDRTGMTMMQMWHDADAPTRVVILFDVHDCKRAEAWAQTQTALGTQVQARYLRTV